MEDCLYIQTVLRILQGKQLVYLSNTPGVDVGFPKGVLS